MKRILIAAFAGAFLVACNNEKKDDNKTSDATKETKTEEAWVPVDSATMMKNMMDYGTPGPMHQLMASWDGTWTGEMTMWEYEGVEPKKSSGTAVNTMAVGGKYQITKHTGDMMGMPFEGLSILAYDNSTKKFSNSWIDSWSTGIMMMYGDWDDATKTLTLSGTFPDINRPGKECSMKQVIKVIDENTHNMVMYGPDQKTGKEFKMMDMTLTRKK